jgi:fructose-specific phosphotransferase system IIA component
MMKTWSDMLEVERIKDIESHDKKSALKEMAELMATSPKVTDAAAFEKAIFEREEILSTGIGFGIAIPHAKVDAVKDFVIAVGRSHHGIEFEAFDHMPVTIIVMIGASAKQKDNYVRVLAKVSRLLKSEDKRNAILAAENSHEILEVFTTGEV